MAREQVGRNHRPTYMCKRSKKDAAMLVREHS
jgi:hypothetical protein